MKKVAAALRESSALWSRDCTCISKSSRKRRINSSSGSSNLVSVVAVVVVIVVVVAPRSHSSPSSHFTCISNKAGRQAGRQAHHSHYIIIHTTSSFTLHHHLHDNANAGRSTAQNPSKLGSLHTNLDKGPVVVVEQW